MKDISKKVLASLVTSDSWRVFKEDIVQPFINNVKDVTVPIKDGLEGEELSGAEAYTAKKYAALKIGELVRLAEKQNSKDISHKENYK